ncbi:MAG: hypothetical protein IT287_08380 [Bdellovibrionaceae bacterium]|nr:hypothetical protein [Pseudobdellovibrionaceae bacterium]
MKRARTSAAVSVHISYAILLVIFFIGIPPLVNFIFRSYYYAPHLQIQQNHFMDVDARIRQDLSYLVEHPLFPTTPYARNAHEVLRDKVKWLDANKNNDSDFIEKHSRFFERITQGALAMGTLTTKEHLLHLHAEYIKHMGTIDGLLWMPSLLQYDHWSYLEDTEYKTYLKAVPSESTLNRVAIAASLPVPMFNLLKSLALVYFMDRWQSGAPEEGLRVLRQLAFLQHTSGSLIGQSSAVDILKIEAQLARIFEITDWISFSEKTLNAYKRVSWAWIGVLFYVRSPHELETYRSFMKPELGVCTAIHEMPMSYIGLSDLLDKKWWMELNMLPFKKEAINLMSELQKKCHAEPLSVFLSPIPDSHWFVADKVFDFDRMPAQGWAPETHFNRAKIPYLRQMQGMYLEVVASPNYFTQYK